MDLSRQLTIITASRLTALVCGALLTVWLPFPLHASQASGATAQASSNSVAEPGTNPERLKQQTRVTIETNAAPAGITTNGVARKDKSFDWNSSWKGWDGLHVGLTRKTLLGQFVPGVTNAEINMRLEEARMDAKIGGKLALDAAGYLTGKEFQNFDDYFELRRARVYAKGDCLLIFPVSYQIEVGYVPNQFYIEESYLAFRNLPWIGELKVGQYQAPMGLDVITSSRDITFMEPAAPMQALAPGVNAGIQIGRPIFDQRMTWKLGLFTDGVGNDFGEASRDYGRAITRLTGLPIYHADPDRPGFTRLLHLGLSANILYSSSGSVRYQSRPESHLAPHVIDTGDISADGALVIGAEGAWVNGPFSVQGEYLHSWVHQDGGQAPGFDGLYASASWFLTGESRPYDRTEGHFGRVIPKQNFEFGHGGWGAWEVGGRGSFVNLDSGSIQGGRLSMLMTGVNWYLHSHVKWRFEYGFGHVTGRTPEGYLNIFQSRIEVDF